MASTKFSQGPATQAFIRSSNSVIARAVENGATWEQAWEQYLAFLTERNINWMFDGSVLIAGYQVVRVSDQVLLES